MHCRQNILHTRYITSNYAFGHKLVFPVLFDNLCLSSDHDYTDKGCLSSLNSSSIANYLFLILPTFIENFLLASNCLMVDGLMPEVKWIGVQNSDRALCCFKNEFP